MEDFDPFGDPPASASDPLSNQSPTQQDVSRAQLLMRQPVTRESQMAALDPFGDPPAGSGLLHSQQLGKAPIAKWTPAKPTNTAGSADPLMQEAPKVRAFNDAYILDYGKNVFGVDPSDFKDRGYDERRRIIKQAAIDYARQDGIREDIVEDTLFWERTVSPLYASGGAMMVTPTNALKETSALDAPYEDGRRRFTQDYERFLSIAESVAGPDVADTMDGMDGQDRARFMQNIMREHVAVNNPDMSDDDVEDYINNVVKPKSYTIGDDQVFELIRQDREAAVITDGTAESRAADASAAGNTKDQPGVIGDALRGVGAGVVSGLGGLASAVGLEYEGESVGENLRQVAADIRATQSLETQAAYTRLSQAIENGDTGDAASTFYNTPSLITTMLGESLGFVGGSGGLAGGARALLARGFTTLATRGAATAAGIGGTSLASGGNLKDDAREFYLQKTDEEIRALPDYEQRRREIGEDADEDDVREAMASTAGVIGLIGGTAVGILGGALSRPVAQIAGGQIGRGLQQVGAQGVIRTAGSEAASEFVEEGGQAVAEAVATGRDPLTASTAVQAGVGAALGGIAGAGVGVIGKVKGGPEEDNTTPATPKPAPVNDEANAVVKTKTGKTLDEVVQEAHVAGVVAAKQTRAEKKAANSTLADQLDRAYAEEGGVDSGVNSDMPDINLDDLRAQPAKVGSDKDNVISEEIKSAAARVGHAKISTPYSLFAPDEKVPDTSIGIIRAAVNKVGNRVNAYDLSYFNQDPAVRAQSIRVNAVQRAGLDETTGNLFIEAFKDATPATIHGKLDALLVDNPELQPSVDFFKEEMDTRQQFEEYVERMRPYAFRPKTGRKALSSAAMAPRAEQAQREAGQLLGENQPPVTLKGSAAKNRAVMAAQTAEKTDIVERLMPVETEKARGIIAWRDTDTEAGMLYPFVATAKSMGRLLYDSLNTMSHFRTVDNVAKQRSGTYSQDSGVYGSIMMGQRRSVVNLDQGRTAAEGLMQEVARGARDAGRELSLYQQQVGAYMFLSHGAERARARWAFDNYLALTPVGRDQFKKLMTEIETNPNLDEGDAVRIRAALEGLYTNKTTANLSKVIKRDDYRVRVPGQKDLRLNESEFKREAAKLADILDATGGEGHSARLLERAAELSRVLRAAQVESNVASVPQRNLMKVYGFKNYVPMQEKSALVDPDVGGDEVYSNFINYHYKGMQGQKNKGGVEDPYAMMQAADPIKRLVGMTVHASHHIADNRMSEALIRASGVLGMPNVMTTTTVSRVWNDDTGKFIYDKNLPAVQNLDEYLHRNEDGSVVVLKVADARLRKAIEDRKPKSEELNLFQKGAGRVTRAVARSLTLDPRFILGTSLPRDAMEAFFVVADAKGYGAAFRAFKNNWISMLKAKPIYDFYKTDAAGREKLLPMMRQDPLLKYAAMRYELMGLEGYSGSLSVDNFDPSIANRDPLRKNTLARVDDTIGKVVAPFESLATTADNLLRDAAFKALIDSGVAPKDAASKIQQIMAFSQKTRFTKAGNYFAFFNTSLVGLNNTVTRRLWNNGEPPIRTYKDATGNTVVQVDWEKALPNINQRMVVGSMAMAMMPVFLAASIYDDEEFARMPVFRFMQFVNVPISGLWGEDGHPVSAAIPVQYGLQMLSTSIGAAVALAAMGKHDMSDIATSLAEVFMANGIPIGRFSPDSMMNDYVRGGVYGVMRNLIAGATPTAVAPIMQLFVNRNGLMAPIYRENFNTQDGLLARAQKDKDTGFVKPFANTPEMFNGLAESAAGTKAGEFFNLNAPESWQHLLRSYGLPIGRIYLDVMRNAQRAAEDPDYTGMDAVWQTAGLPGKRVQDTKYATRRLVDGFNSEYRALDKEREELREQDKRNLKRNNYPDSFTGPLEREFLKENPEWLKSKRVLDTGFRKMSKLNDKIVKERRQERPDLSVVHAYKVQVDAIYEDMFEELSEVFPDD